MAIFSVKTTTGLQGLIQPKNDSGYCFLVQKVWHLNSKTVENENCSLKWYHSYSKLCTQRVLYLKTKLIYYSKAYLSRLNIKHSTKDLSLFNSFRSL